MFAVKKMWGVLTLVLALGLGTGCDNVDTSPEDEIIDWGILSYNIDEIAGGFFGVMIPTMTMNEWFAAVTRQESYDKWAQQYGNLYKDENLEMPFIGSDIVDENTIVYCMFPLNGQGRKIGEITGTITLTDIPGGAAKVYIQNNSANSREYWWFFNRKIDIKEISGDSVTVDWSLPVYESFRPNSENAFRLLVLPDDSLRYYTVPVPATITIGDANADVGDLGTVSVKGVTLSGTLNVTYNGEPVPYVEIYAIFEVLGTIGITGLFSPGPDAPWSITFGRDPNEEKDIQFRVVGYSERKGTRLFDMRVPTDPPVLVINNQSESGIVLDMEDQGL